MFLGIDVKTQFTEFANVPWIHPTCGNLDYAPRKLGDNQRPQQVRQMFLEA